MRGQALYRAFAVTECAARSWNEGDSTARTSLARSPASRSQLPFPGIYVASQGGLARVSIGVLTGAGTLVPGSRTRDRGTCSPPLSPSQRAHSLGEGRERKGRHMALMAPAPLKYQLKGVVSRRRPARAPMIPPARV